MQQTKAHGFTLVELMVVISIISVLAAVTFSSINDSRAVARDTKRVSDMEAIDQALFLYRQANGDYPSVGNIGQMIGVGNDIDTALAPYLSRVPQDPSHDAGNGIAPEPGSLYFYSYNPQHLVSTTDCSGTTGRTGVVFGFNMSETRGVVRQATCQDNEMN